MQIVQRLSWLLPLLVMTLVTGQPAQPLNKAEIRRALAAHDRAVLIKEDWVRDPYIILAPDGYYYYTGTTQMPTLKPTAESKYNTGLGLPSLAGWHVRVWRSRDLIDWESLGSPFTMKQGIWHETAAEKFKAMPETQWRLWAPELHWFDGRWALIHTSPAPVRGANFALSAGKKLQGPWTQPLGTKIGIRHDPSLFRDDDGTWWMIWGATEIAPLKPDLSDFASAPTRIGPSGEMGKMGHEGCLIKKLGGKYVLFGTGWSTGQMRKGSYNLYYATSDKVTGPYSERKFVGRFLGHGTPFQDKQGRWWSTAFYNANVPPISSEGINMRDLSENAQTINDQGLTLVPLTVSTINGELVIRAKDSRYAVPGPDEVQKFFSTR